MKKIVITDGIYPKVEQKNNDNEYHGNGWSVKKSNGKFIFSYISGSLQGTLKTIEISEADYNSMRENKLTFDELCIKYDIS